MQIELSYNTQSNQSTVIKPSYRSDAKIYYERAIKKTRILIINENIEVMACSKKSHLCFE